MNLDLSTELWMLGVIVFGIIFYVISMYYAKKSDNDEV